MTEWHDVIIAGIAALGVGGIAVAWMRRQVTAAEAAKTQAESAKAQAEADVTQGEGWQALLAAQQRQMDRMAAELEMLRLAKLACEAELGEMRRRLAALERATNTARATTPKLDAPRKPKPVNGSAT